MTSLKTQTEIKSLACEALEPRLAPDGGMGRPVMIFFGGIGVILIVPILIVGFTVVRIVVGSFIHALRSANKRGRSLHRVS